MCYFLDTCEASVTDECLEAETCNSGPLDCNNNNNCQMLETNVDDAVDEIYWQCDKQNPYTQQVPEGSTCFLT